MAINFLCFVVVEVQRDLGGLLDEEKVLPFALLRREVSPVTFNLQGADFQSPAGRDENVHCEYHQVATFSRLLPRIHCHFKIVALQSASLDNLLPAKRQING